MTDKLHTYMASMTVVVHQPPAVQVRVLAARDSSGAIPLLQARTARNSMMSYKYGWQSEPRLFTPADAAPPHAMAAVRRSMEQGRRGSMDAGGGSGSNTPGGTSRRRSSDHGRASGGTPSQQQHHHQHHAGGRLSGRNSSDPHHSPQQHGGAGHANGHSHAGNGRHHAAGTHQNHHQQDQDRRSPGACAQLQSCNNTARSGRGGSPSTPASRASGQQPCAATTTAGIAHLNINAKAFVPGGSGGGAAAAVTASP